MEKKLSKIKIKLEWEENIINGLIKGIDDKKLGARPLIKKITDCIEDKISDEIIKKPKLRSIKISNKDGTIRVKGN